LEPDTLESQSNPLKQWFSTWGSQPLWGLFAFFWELQKLLIKIFIIFSTFYISHIEPLFAVTKTTGSPGKNDLKLFLSMIMNITKL